MSNPLGSTPKRCLKQREKSDDEENPHESAIDVSDVRVSESSAPAPSRGEDASRTQPASPTRAWKTRWKWKGREHRRSRQVAQPERFMEMVDDMVDCAIDRSRCTSTSSPADFASRFARFGKPSARQPIRCFGRCSPFTRRGRPEAEPARNYYRPDAPCFRQLRIQERSGTRHGRQNRDKSHASRKLFRQPRRQGTDRFA